MKKIFLFVLIASVIYSQEKLPEKSLIEMKYEYSNNRDMQLPNNGLAGNSLNLIKSDKYLDSKLPTQSSRKNPGLAILYSLLLPGMGELYAGDYSSGKYFTIADGVLWGVFTGFTTYGNWKRDNYKSFAESNAGVDLNGKDSDFFANVGIYINVDEYNRIQDLNRDYNLEYNTTRSYWNWSSESQRIEYRQMWSSSESAFNNVRFAVGALILNRLISAINAVRLVSAYNKNLPVETSWNMSLGVENTPSLPSSIKFNFIKSF